MGKTKFKLGPKAMKGNIWDENLDSAASIIEILISHQQDSINSIQFTYYSDYEIMPSKIFGEPCGLKFNTVLLDGNEFLVSLSGKYDKEKEGKLVSIVFGTNKRKYGPFGRTGGVDNADLYDDFSYEFGPRDCFGGFHGSVYNGSVHAIGVYVKNHEVRDDDCLFDGSGRWNNFMYTL